MEPKVTVLMPVYNGERYLRETMESILGQTFSDFEFLIVDDGSTDGSAHIIDSYRDDRIRVLKNPTRLKLSGALNRGLDEARGEYIARMDADDISLAKRLAIQVAFLEQHKDMGICGSWVKMFGCKRTTIYRAPVGYEHIRAKALFDNPFVHPSVMIRKKLFDRFTLRYDGSYYPTEDYELWTRAVPCFPCDNIPEVLLHYRIHPDSMTTSDWSRMDGKGVLITTSVLASLGLDISEEQLSFHRNIGREMSCRLPTYEDLLRAEQWLSSILAINRQKKVYRETALKDIVSDTWFRLCFNSSQLGLSVVRKFVSSSLTVTNRKSYMQSGLIAASALRFFVVSSPRISG